MNAIGWIGSGLELSMFWALEDVVMASHCIWVSEQTSNFEILCKYGETDCFINASKFSGQAHLETDR